MESSSHRKRDLAWEEGQVWPPSAPSPASHCAPHPPPGHLFQAGSQQRALSALPACAYPLPPPLSEQMARLPSLYADRGALRPSRRGGGICHEPTELASTRLWPLRPYLTGPLLPRAAPSPLPSPPLLQPFRGLGSQAPPRQPPGSTRESPDTSLRPHSSPEDTCVCLGLRSLERQRRGDGAEGNGGGS